MSQYLTRARAAEMKLVYFLKRGDEDEKEVSLAEYMKAASPGNKDFGLPPDHVPRVFMGHAMTGHFAVKEGETEETLVG